jgi:hypothetical protein
MIELGLLLLAGAAILTGVIALAVILKAVLWVVLLPVRLLFWGLGALLFLPLLLFKFLFGGLLLILALPIIVVSLVAAAAAAAAALLVPHLPLLLRAAVIWLLVRPQPAAGALKPGAVRPPCTGGSRSCQSVARS